MRLAHGVRSTRLLGSADLHATRDELGSPLIHWFRGSVLLEEEACTEGFGGAHATETDATEEDAEDCAIR